MRITLDWLGCATFRLTLGETVVFLDAYMDRVPSAPPVGLSAHDVDRADFVLVGHSHFDHVAGAEIIAANTGATVIGSAETCRLMREKGVPEKQLKPSFGGERYRLAPGVTVRLVPSLHAATWNHLPDPNTRHEGHLGLTEDERAALPSLAGAIGDLARAESPEARAMLQHVIAATGSRDAGGPLGYLFETPQGAIYWHDTSGCWTGVLGGLRADVAILAAAGCANIDGEPVQGTIADFIAMEARLLGGPRIVILGHHDNWMPPLTNGDFDSGPIRDALERELPGTTLLEPRYLEGTPIGA